MFPSLTEYYAVPERVLNVLFIYAQREEKQGVNSDMHILSMKDCSKQLIKLPKLLIILPLINPF
jgi:hypothetical protein